MEAQFKSNGISIDGVFYDYAEIDVWEAVPPIIRAFRWAIATFVAMVLLYYGLWFIAPVALTIPFILSLFNPVTLVGIPYKDVDNDALNLAKLIASVKGQRWPMARYWVTRFPSRIRLARIYLQWFRRIHVYLQNRKYKKWVFWELAKNPTKGIGEVLKHVNKQEVDPTMVAIYCALNPDTAPYLHQLEFFNLVDQKKIDNKRIEMVKRICPDEDHFHRVLSIL